MLLKLLALGLLLPWCVVNTVFTGHPTLTGHTYPEDVKKGSVREKLGLSMASNVGIQVAVMTDTASL